MLESDWTSVSFFRSDEFDSPELMNPALIRKLEIARCNARVPFVISSSYRLGDLLSHGDGDAVDIVCENSDERMRIVSSLLFAGFVRIGVYPRHVHADVSVRLPQNVFWIGDYDGQA